MATVFCIFLGRVLWNYWTVVGSFVLMAEPILRFLWHGYDSWATRYVTPIKRRRIAQMTAIASLFFAAYLAFYGEYQRADHLAGVREVHRHLSEAEVNRIKLYFKDAQSAIPAILVCSVSEPEAQRYAADFTAALHLAGMNVHSLLSACVTIRDDDRGIMVGLRDREHPSFAASEFLKRMLACGFRITETNLMDWESPQPVDFDLFIAEPEQ
ncbi:MAG: hypothetical protein JO157_06850 [Acetobacteraceae bacterium]|nr:hypothetical protein [Acetobacteraceae bacterium]